MFVCFITDYYNNTDSIPFKGFRLVEQYLLLASIYCSAGNGKFAVLTTAVYLSYI